MREEGLIPAIYAAVGAINAALAGISWVENGVGIASICWTLATICWVAGVWVSASTTYTHGKIMGRLER